MKKYREDLEHREDVKEVGRDAEKNKEDGEQNRRGGGVKESPENQKRREGGMERSFSVASLPGLERRALFVFIGVLCESRN
ncbi:hypothetical protein JTE90_021780 [Oedothorax gibbosus]|uniref:Uncharacterized protein n=1 Tax=Oedothorax gibbosus TaxID=931172 RepID=A0AAV6USB6_9ARAC|nr:hypothetical protein JTE90_021780 [Oedothorax gibbosus]